MKYLIMRGTSLPLPQYVSMSCYLTYHHAKFVLLILNPTSEVRTTALLLLLMVGK